VGPRSVELLLPDTPPGLLDAAPFLDEESYWALVRARLVARARRLSIEEAQRNTLLQPGHDDSLPSRRRDVRRATTLALANTERRFAQAYDTRLTLTGTEPTAPRIVRILRATALTRIELDILHYMVLASCDPLFCELRGRWTEVYEVASFLAMDSTELFSVFDERGKLTSLGLVSIESQLEPSLLRSRLLMDFPVVQVLRGVDMTVEQRFAVAQGPLRDVLDMPKADGGRTSALGAQNHTRDVDGEWLAQDDGAAAPAGIEATDGDDSSEPLLDETDPALEVQSDEFDLDKFLRASGSPPVAKSEGEGGDAPADVLPYRTDIEYLESHLEWMKARFQWKKIAYEGDSARAGKQDLMSAQSRMRELQGRERALFSLTAERTERTRRLGGWEPRAEQLARHRGLDDFDKHILLLLAGLSGALEFRNALEMRRPASVEIGELLMMFFEDTSEQVRRRRHFYRDAPLVRDRLIAIDDTVLARDLLGQDVRLDPRMAEYLLGIEAEDSNLVEGSHLYRPAVALDRVVLPEGTKQLVVRTVEQYPRFLEVRKRSGLDELVPTGSGIVLLFHGPSGTGKTMLANALAAHIGKRILLVNFPTIGTMGSDDTLRFLFREARIHDAVLFFDECEGIFQAREQNPGMSLILTEIERHDGLVILATNRPFELDEAMRRRITLSVAFTPPDAQQRERIWLAHVPAGMKLADDPDFRGLAYRYELTGGLIKNAVVTALSMASSRDGDDPVVRADDFETGARLQVQNRFGPSAHDEAVPKRGLAALVVPASARLLLEQIVGFEKARRTLANEWGFASHMESGSGVTALFYGHPGTGKSLAAEAVAYELGRPLRRVNAARVVSMWVGEGAKRIEELFQEARGSEAVLVFDEADALFAGRTGVASSTDRYANLDVAILLREMERFPGVAILTTNIVENLDAAFRRRLRFVVEFPVPDAAAREALWRMHLPPEAPVASDVDLSRLAVQYDLTGAQIRNAAIKAAAQAAMRPDVERVICQADLAAAARAERLQDDERRSVGF